MKSNYYLNLLILMFGLNVGYSQYTSVPDPNFEQALVDLGIDDIMDGQVLNWYTYPVTSLDLSNKDINDLTGIKAFQNLTFLNISSNNLTNIDLSYQTDLSVLYAHSNNLEILDVSANNNLSELYCHNNNISSLTLSSGLTYLNASSNNLAALDLSPCIDIEELQLSYNSIEILNATENPFLQILTAAYNNLLTVDISNCFGLEHLRLEHNPLVNIDLSVNSNLREMRLDNTAITELDIAQNTLLNSFVFTNNTQFNESLDLSQNTLLTEFYSSNTPIPCIQVANEGEAENGNGLYEFWSIDEVSAYSEDCYTTVAIPDVNFEQALIDQGLDTIIDGMVLRSNISDVTTINLANYNINDPTGIESFESLVSLQANGNNFAVIDLSENIHLEVVNVSNNELTTLNLATNTSLRELRCSNNNLSSLDLSANINLKFLFCQSNFLTSLSLPDNITHVHAYNNLLENLDINHCLDLKFLVLNINLLTNIEVHNNDNLEVLDLEYNLLDELDVSANSNLLALNASFNSISEIFLENCPQLEELRMYNNTLEAIDVTSNHNLEILHLRSNNLSTIDVSQNEALEYLLLQTNLNLAGTIDLTNNLQLISLNLIDTDINCVRVNDEVAANNNEDLYTNWVIPTTASYTETTCDVLSVGQIMDKDDLSVFPNPVSDNLNISILNSAYKNSITEIQMVDVSGKIVFSSMNYTEKINIQSLAQGMYILKIYSSKYSTEIRKILIK